MLNKTMYLVGFGSQGSAWAHCLRQSGWTVQVYLARKAESFQRALDLGYEPRLLHELPGDLLIPEVGAAVKSDLKVKINWIALLCPDSAIAPIYQEYLSSSTADLRLILAHGFAIYTGALNLTKPEHQAVLLAPKAIGPQLLKNYQAHAPKTHSLAAAIYPSSTKGSEESNTAGDLKEIARDLGFHSDSLIPATFQQETVGDLMSEQGLLCGGVFNLLEWTMESMAEAGIPDALIREECLTELELIAGMIRERGPGVAFKAISQAAQCGTIAMADRFQKANFKADFKAQMKTILNQEFAQLFQTSDWRSQANDLAKRLTRWQERLQ